MMNSSDSETDQATLSGESTEFRFGLDVDVNTDDEEITCQHVRVKRIENLKKEDPFMLIDIIDYFWARMDET
jgi:hypothetical protein